MSIVKKVPDGSLPNGQTPSRPTREELDKARAEAKLRKESAAKAPAPPSDGYELPNWDGKRKCWISSSSSDEKDTKAYDYRKAEWTDCTEYDECK
jgi:hypothetical protein